MLLLLVHTTPLFLFADLHPLIQCNILQNKCWQKDKVYDNFNLFLKLSFCYLSEEWSATTCKTLVCVCIAHCAMMQNIRVLWIAGCRGRVWYVNTIIHTCAPTTIVCVSVFHGVWVCLCAHWCNISGYYELQVEEGCAVCYANTICRTQTGTQAVAMCCISWITLHTQHKHRDTKKNTNDRGNCHVL